MSSFLLSRKLEGVLPMGTQPPQMMACCSKVILFYKTKRMLTNISGCCEGLQGLSLTKTIKNITLAGINQI